MYVTAKYDHNLVSGNLLMLYLISVLTNRDRFVDGVFLLYLEYILRSTIGCRVICDVRLRQIQMS